MYPTSEEFCRLIDNILTNSPLGNPTKANMYKTHGYSAETPLIPFSRIKRISKYYGKMLKVSVNLSKKGNLIEWETTNPSSEDIIKALIIIEHGIYHSFVVLSKSEMDYIQTNVKCLEFQDGSLTEHYYCPPEFLSSATIQKAFLSYAQSCSWWRKQIFWKKGFSH